MKGVKHAIGQRLKKLREELNLSQGKMANLLGVSQSALSKWESGKREIPIGVLIKLKQKFNVNLNWLLSGQGDMFLPPQEIPLLVPELVEFFKQYPPDIQRKFANILKEMVDYWRNRANFPIEGG